ncbi:hypothetical protein [Variovorax guangxiensis]|uniref:hypothetical protein n=1 Tax=Variovorax guangxiensis TaxID=1775474 RepID=UPI0021A6EF38|nr:hypothetical protein [Variovorax guangxiensis]
MTLSQRRARSVEAYLVDHASRKRVGSPEGRGQTQPVASNATEVGACTIAAPRSTCGPCARPGSCSRASSRGCGLRIADRQAGPADHFLARETARAANPALCLCDGW